MVVVVVVVNVVIMSGSQGTVEAVVMTVLVIIISDSYDHCIHGNGSTGDTPALVESGSGHMLVVIIRSGN